MQKQYFELLQQQQTPALALIKKVQIPRKVEGLETYRLQRHAALSRTPSLHAQFVKLILLLDKGSEETGADFQESEHRFQSLTIQN